MTRPLFEPRSLAEADELCDQLQKSALSKVYQYPERFNGHAPAVRDQIRQVHEAALGIIRHYLDPAYEGHTVRQLTFEEMNGSPHPHE